MESKLVTFTVSNLAEKDQIKNAIKSLEAVSAATAPELSNVTKTFYSFLKLINTQDESWTKLRTRINREYPDFISKLQVAFVYYYAKLLEKCFLNTEEEIKSPKEFKSKIQEMKSFITSSNSNGSDLFDRIFSGKTPGFEANELAKNFFESSFSLHKDLLKVNDFQLDPSNTSPLDYFKGPAKELSEKEKGDILKHISAVEKSEHPELRIYSMIVEYLFNTENLENTFVSTDLLNNNKFNDLLNSIKSREVKQFYRDFLSDLNATPITEDKRKEVLKQLADVSEVISPETKKEEKPKEEEAVEHLKNGASERELLAMNMADYITGRITATEFQQRDIKIKSGQEMLLNEDE